jgi:hypothetical protein
MSWSKNQRRWWQSSTFSYLFTHQDIEGSQKKSLTLPLFVCYGFVVKQSMQLSCSVSLLRVFIAGRVQLGPCRGLSPSQCVHRHVPPRGQLRSVPNTPTKAIPLPPTPAIFDSKKATLQLVDMECGGLVFVLCFGGLKQSMVSSQY